MLPGVVFDVDKIHIFPDKVVIFFSNGYVDTLSYSKEFFIEEGQVKVWPLGEAVVLSAA